MKRTKGKLPVARENMGDVSPEARAKKDDGYAARRAAADAEQAPIVRELVRGFEAEADAWWAGLKKSEQRRECA